MEFLHSKIKHIIYVVKENRTFDQILGDLGNGSNGDPSLTLFGEAVTPSFHRMSREFVTLDNFMDPGDGLDGRLVLVHAWPGDQYGDGHAADKYARVTAASSYEGEARTGIFQAT